MSAALVGALLAGLIGSPHCVGMCGGLAAAGSGRSAMSAATWHFGRLLAYIGLGAFGGGAGGLRLGIPGAAVAALLLVAFAARLAGIGPGVSLPWLSAPFSALLRRAGASLTTGSLLGRLALGALTGLLPCGLLWSAIALAVAAGSPALGALSMAVFWLGTVPLLAGASAGARRLLSGSPWLRRGLAVGVLASGLWSISSRMTVDSNQPQCACTRVAP